MRYEKTINDHTGRLWAWREKEGVGAEAWNTHHYRIIPCSEGMGVRDPGACPGLPGAKKEQIRWASKVGDGGVGWFWLNLGPC